MLNRLKYARFRTKSRKMVRVGSIWLGLGRYFIEIDPIWFRMPPICLPDSKIPPKNPKIQGIREIGKNPGNYPIIPFGV